MKLRLHLIDRKIYIYISVYNVLEYNIKYVCIDSIPVRQIP